jgi:D-alanyl-D-alanine carboxypeptidase
MTGLDISANQPGAAGNAKDVSFLMEYILINYPEILTPTQKASARVYNSTGQYHDVENTNDIVNRIPNVLGSKTGFTDLAGGNLTIAFDIGLNRPIIVTVLGSSREERFSDVLTIIAAVQKSIE